MKKVHPVVKQLTARPKDAGVVWDAAIGRYRWKRWVFGNIAVGEQPSLDRRLRIFRGARSAFSEGLSLRGGPGTTVPDLSFGDGLRNTSQLFVMDSRYTC
jgi:hypothetical protein